MGESKLEELRGYVNEAWENGERLHDEKVQNALVTILRMLESGALRVAAPAGLPPTCGDVPMTGDLREWEVFGWIKQAVLLTLRWRSAQPIGGRGAIGGQTIFQGRSHGGLITYHDKLDVRSDLGEKGVRIVPPGSVREGAYVAPGVIVMPGFVNIGAHVHTGTMVDTWATVGSCAQVGAHVHLAGGVGVGGVLEPPNARPVLIGDNAFLGSRAIVVEGAVVSAGAVLGANVCITASTPIYDVTTTEKKEYRGYVPPNAVVAPGTRPKQFPGGEVQLQCAYIIGYRSTGTDSKVSLNAILRETGLPV